ncbi:DUF2851 family protein [Dyadobacter sp. CY312]|uniref:DUF2851 family protein n=1 Tax=Dyadobacter sp. CY312 TaxID=2907303 RepID=UPI001F2C059B|nr:DUF2851 family protein [Dyadobacter sp. CY312]MCE7039627.1 DUF2851 family protein [Dyadobacter sp. CY312]
MNEEILSFIWRFQYFEMSGLQTDEGQLLSVVRPGLKNANAGPDFSGSRVTIAGVNWAGSVEIHTKSSDWFQHLHESDNAYETVILHVVWENDKPVYRKDGSLLPTLTLKGLVHLSVIERYNKLIGETDEIPCSKSFDQVSKIHKLAMLDRSLLDRLYRKGSLVIDLLNENNQDWEETSYQWLTQHFGFKLNDPAFLRLSQILPLKTILKHRDNLLQVEALLFGCAGLIPEIKPDLEITEESAYPRELRREFQFLAAKYQLSQMQHHEWKLMRLRPAGFPTIRLAQLAVLISKSNGLFSTFTGTKDVSQLHQLLNLHQSEYWQTHFLFGKKSKTKVPFMGKDASNLLIINAAVPLLVAYSKQRQQPELLDKAMKWLSEIHAENNQITRKWEVLGMKVKTAADSQALIERYNGYCTQKQCLKCSVGMSLIRSR